MPKGSDGRWTFITPEEGRATKEGPVVDGFPMRYAWHIGPWEELFDLQIDLVKNDIRRARVEGKLIVYLSCPISSRGGGYYGTNDAFYFLGPRDVQAFFLQEGVSLTAGLEAYFARRYATDPDFRNDYAVEGIVWGRTQPSRKQRQLREQWQRQRMDFFRYYGLRASANFSLGSHDEWNLFQLLNQRRRDATKGKGQVDGDVSIQIAGFFDGGQLDPGSTEMLISRGYAL